MVDVGGVNNGPAVVVPSDLPVFGGIVAHFSLVVGVEWISLWYRHEYLKRLEMVSAPVNNVHFSESSGQDIWETLTIMPV